VTFHIFVDHVWRHDVASISESALVLGGLVIFSKENCTKVFVQFFVHVHGSW
jgi:hypothetical protein